MADKELTPNQIEYLSWKVMAGILERIDGELFLADLHPGGGQYDCLSLVSSAPEIVLMLNRNGTSASSSRNAINGIWERAALQDTDEAALFILSELEMHVDESAAQRNKKLIETCNRIAYWVRSRSKGLGSAQCCWFDGNYDVGPANSLLSQVKIPESWKALEAPYRGSDWSALIYAMTLPNEKTGDEVIGLVNMKTGEAINPDGNPWLEWKAPMPPLRRIVPTDKNIDGSPKTITYLPYIEPHPDGVAAFKKVGNFDGYKVLGEELVHIASAIAEEWNTNRTLPTDLDQLKGTLFYLSRMSRFVDGYPSEDDVPFLQALVAAIEAEER
jgi:hypothetical protein